MSTFVRYICYTSIMCSAVLNTVVELASSSASGDASSTHIYRTQGTDEDDINRQIAKRVLQTLMDTNDVNGIQITITNSCLDAHIRERFSNVSVVVLGIHTVYLIPRETSVERIMLEYTALFVLCDIAHKFLEDNPHIPIHERTVTKNSFLFAVSDEAFRMFQCYVLGLRTLQAMHAKRKLNLREVLVKSEDYGVLEVPSHMDRNLLAERTQFTPHLAKAMRIKEGLDEYGFRVIDTSYVVYNQQKFFLQPCQDNE